LLKQKKNINLRKAKKIVRSLNDLADNYNKKLEELLLNEGFVEAHAYAVLVMQKVVIPQVKELYMIFYTTHNKQQKGGEISAGKEEKKVQ